jgi:hypothetical protein
MDQQDAKFEGWALVELYGHGREAGYVTTQHFGAACMFQVDVPEVPARQETLERPQWGEDRLLPAGTVIERVAVPGRTRLLGVGSIYAMNPASEEVVRAAVSQSGSRAIKVISLPEGVALPAPSEDYEEEVDEEDEERPF